VHGRLRCGLLCFVLAACGRSGSEAPSNPAPSAQAWPEADALFHQDPRWLGADGAYSVDLGDGRVLWLFGDTLVATSPANLRSQSTLVHNTVAIQTGYNPSNASIAFHWATSAGKPAAVFAATGGEWFWPAHGAMVDGRLVIFLSRVTSADNGLGFQGVGWAAVRIDSPAGDPANWAPVTLATPNETLGVTFGETALVRSGFLYVFGAEDVSHAVYLVRWPTGAVAEGDLSAPEWWTPSGWIAQASLSALPAPLFADGSTELSVQPDPRGPGWLEVQTAGFGAATLDLRTSSDVTGPWGTLTVFYTPPESQIPNVLIYAGKGHPEQVGAQLVATYAANSSDSGAIVADTNLYYPKFVRANWVTADATAE
jgi:hypothetical protein